MARPTKPTSLKLLKGTARACRINKNEPTPDLGVPEIPDHLSERAASVYPRVAAMLSRMKVLTVADGMGLEALCQAYCDWRDAVEFLDQNGRSYEVERCSPDGVTHTELKPYPEVAQRNEADRRLRGWLQSFGLTPADRSKVSALVDDKKESPWAKVAG